ncbi:hypothetical protein B0H14DRAFT_3862130 [Mycena olivaceomarginata]|nr:hypothetical protein B0H14DRAFT_3862130 [Mycena olivaceomarginata]
MPSPPRHIVSLLTSHGITPHVGHAIAHAPKNQARASPLHYVEGIPGVSWPTSVPIQGQRLRNRKLGKVVGDNEIGAVKVEKLAPELGLPDTKKAAQMQTPATTRGQSPLRVSDDSDEPDFPPVATLSASFGPPSPAFSNPTSPLFSSMDTLA